jgi:hypothetical protein
LFLYCEQVDYHTELVPPLDPADAAWAVALLRGQGLRLPVMEIVSRSVTLVRLVARG